MICRFLKFFGIVLIFAVAAGAQLPPITSSSAAHGTATLSSPYTAPGDFYFTGPDPFLDIVAFGAKGDAQAFTTMGASSTTITVASGSSTKFAATDCTGGTGCTGSVNKYIAISGGGPNPPSVVPTLTAASGGSELANFLAFKVTCTQDNGTILNGESLSSTESTITVTANQKVTTAAAPSCGANTNGTPNGYRVYLTDPTEVTETIVLTGGAGYTSPVMTFNGGTCGTTPTASLTTAGYGASGGYVAWGTPVTLGACSVSPTSCTISGGGASSNATATCTYTGTSPNIALSKITINNNGAGYTMPTIASSGGGVAGLVSSPLITSTAGSANAGTLTGVQILNPGWFTSLPTAVPTGTLSGGGASTQGTFSYQFGGEMLQPYSICSSSSTFHQTLNICDSTATINLTTYPSYVLGMYPPQVAEWFSTENQFNSTTSVGIADTIPNSVSGNVTNGANGTDNSGAFASALAACSSQNSIKTNPGCGIYFPPVDTTAGTAVPTGRYFFNGGIVIGQANVYLIGVGAGTAGNAGAQAQGGLIPGSATASYSRGWTGPQPPSEIVVFSRDWAVQWYQVSGGVEGGGAYNLGVGDLIGQSPGGWFFNGGGSGSSGGDHYVLWNTSAENFGNGDCYAGATVQVSFLYQPVGATCRNGVRWLDAVSNLQIHGGTFTGSQGVNQVSQGPAYCIWESNNPNSSQGPGNDQYFGYECRDFASGWFKGYDHPGAQIFGPKYENIAINTGESCQQQQACMGIGVRMDSYLNGASNNRCSSTDHYAGLFSRTNQDFYIGPNCVGNGIYFPSGVPPTANGDVMYVDNGSKSDLLLGNAAIGAQSGKQNGGIAYMPDVLNSGTTTVNCTNGLMHREAITSGSTITFANPTGCVDNEEVSFEITNSTGSTLSISFGTAYTHGFATLSSVPNGDVCTVRGHWNATASAVFYDWGATSASACH